MARQKNPDRIRQYTPIGTLKWPKLTEVDHGTEKFPQNAPYGIYNTGMIFDGSLPKVQVFLAKLDAQMERAKEIAEEKFAALPLKARKKLEAEGITGPRPDAPYSPIYDEETEEPTGEIEFRVKMKAGGVRKQGPKAGEEWSAQPDLFDSMGKPLPRDVKKGGRVVKKGVQIWGGSTAIVNFDTEPYFVEGTAKYGLQKQLNAAQIIELVQGGQRSASSYGFGAVEGGYDASEHEDEVPEDEDGEAGEGGDDSAADDDNPDF